MPVIVAPVALQRMAHPDGERGMARAAAAAGTIMTLSTIATRTPREVAAAAPGAPRWFQVYVFRDRGVTRRDGRRGDRLRLQRARADRRRAARRPSRARPPHAASRSRPTSTCPPSPRRSATAAGSPSQDFFSLVDPALTWKDLEQLISDSPRPGAASRACRPAEDARLACEHGVAGDRRLEPRRPPARHRRGDDRPAARVRRGGRRAHRGPRRRRDPARNRRARGARAGRARRARRPPRSVGSRGRAARPAPATSWRSCDPRSSSGRSCSEHRIPVRCSEHMSESRQAPERPMTEGGVWPSPFSVRSFARRVRRGMPCAHPA